ncbi:30S ribosomal protein S2 [Candidatus Gottesmanbacteria bacterium]|nr:30S ribosomal protein S2 [Candidatus Gottesmanbacteria bacterium]
MKTITLQELLEAGCHFGHKSERWHPRAQEFIYTKKDGIHIIDLAKTKRALEEAMEYVYKVASTGNTVLFVGTKRQASEIVKSEALQAGAPFFVTRWVGGFLTNWDGIKKNIDKTNLMAKQEAEGAWKIYPKHEQLKLAHHLRKLTMEYEGVLNLPKPPVALFVVDVKKEFSAVREAKRTESFTLGIVDTNTNPLDVDIAIPANDDAVGSITYIVKAIAEAYLEGRDAYKKDLAHEKAVQEQKEAVKEPIKAETSEKEPKAAKKKTSTQ